jgi:outer membrane protein OmpA-like peptidoglycan-associated protein
LPGTIPKALKTPGGVHDNIFYRRSDSATLLFPKIRNCTTPMPPMLSEESLDPTLSGPGQEPSSPPTHPDEDTGLPKKQVNQAVDDVSLELAEIKSHVFQLHTDVARSTVTLKRTVVVASLFVVLSIGMGISTLDVTLPLGKNPADAPRQPDDKSLVDLRVEIGQIHTELRKLDNHLSADIRASSVPVGQAKPTVKLNCESLPANIKTHAVDFSIQFQVGSAKILQDSESTLDNIAKFLALTPELCVLIEGHTDETGDTEKNLALSKDRASAVAGYLAEKPGIKRIHLVPIGKGSSSSAPGVAPSSPLNRRVVFKVVSGSSHE